MPYSSRLLCIIATIASLGFGMVAFALDLNQAKAQGLVGETPTGFVAVVGASTAQTVELVRFVNNAREQEYARIATEQGQTTDVVGRLMAEKLYARAKKGEYLKNQRGEWVKKP